MDFTRVTKDDNLSAETITFSGWVIVFIGSNITSFELFDRKIFDIETNIISWNSFFKGFVMHFDRLNFSR
jgi:hypothetical protein